MKRTIRTLDNGYVFIGLSIWLAFYVAVNLWPATEWLDVTRVSIGSGQSGEQIPMQASREIKRQFSGTWSVTIRRWESRGWVVYCNASGSNNYSPRAELPVNLTLSWWTDGQCPVLPYGRYTVDTRWRIEPYLPFVPSKSVQVTSNIFEVTP